MTAALDQVLAMSMPPSTPPPTPPPNPPLTPPRGVRTAPRRHPSESSILTVTARSLGGFAALVAGLALVWAPGPWSWPRPRS